MQTLLAAILVFSLLGLGLIGFIAYRLWQRYRERRERLLGTLQGQYSFLGKKHLFQASAKDANLFRKSLSQLEAQGISSLYFVHGTFVGDDPLHLINLIETVFPQNRLQMVQRFKRALRRTTTTVSGDFGNYTDLHLRLIKDHSTLRPYNFTWSSGNHHLARLRGCLKLMEHIHQNHSGKEHVLIMGHSHAGQLLALMTRFMHEPAFRQDILHLVLPLIQDREQVLDHINFCKQLRFTFATFGTPARYQWNVSSKTELLHFINHRGELPLGQGLSGAAFTWGGDYIQQWAVPGSDTLSPVYAEYKLNTELDRYLGVGSNLKSFASAFRLKRRLHNQGQHYLVDYQDHAYYPNFVLTLFGHAVYTRVSYLAFHLHTIARHLEERARR